MMIVVTDLFDGVTPETSPITISVIEGTAGTGSGLPDGGTADQVLTKIDATDGNADWRDVAAVVTPDAADVDFTPAGGLSSTNVQAALVELDTEKSAVHSHPYDASGAAATAQAAAIAAAATDATTKASAAQSAAEATAASALSTHAGAADPHPGYLTPAEGNAAYDAIGAASSAQSAAIAAAATDATTKANAAQAASQPLDSDLTAIAALSTTSYGRALLALADAAALRSTAGLVLGTDVYSKAAVDSGFQPLDSDLTAIAALTTTSYGRAFLALADAAAARTALGLGTAALISSTAGGDLSGTLPSPTVAKINGIAVTGTPAVGNVPTATSTSAATWQAPAAGTSIKDRKWTTPASWTLIDAHNDESLDAAWVEVTANANRATWLEGGDALSVKQNGLNASAELTSMVRPLSAIGGAMVATDAFITCYTHFGGWGIQYQCAGLVLADGNTYNAGNHVASVGYPSSGTGTLTTTRSGTGYNTLSAGSGQIQTGYYITTFCRLVKTGTSTWRTDLSFDGVTWLIGSAAETKTITPTHVGYLISSFGSAAVGTVTYEGLWRTTGVS